MLVIEIRTEKDLDFLTLIILTETLDEIGPKSINALRSLLSINAADLVYTPAEDAEEHYDNLIGRISGPGIRSIHVYARNAEDLTDLIVSGTFVQTTTTSDLAKLQPHTVIIKKTGEDRREFDFPSYYAADTFASQYDANAAAVGETVTIRDQTGETVKVYP